MSKSSRQETRSNGSLALAHQPSPCQMCQQSYPCFSPTATHHFHLLEECVLLRTHRVFFLSGCVVETRLILGAVVIFVACPDQLRYTHPVHQSDHAPAINPAGWLASSLLFGIPGLTFAFLFHWAGPSLLRQMSSWWRIFHVLLILPLALMLIASLVGAAIDVRSTSWNALTHRLRLSAPKATAWIWAAALSGFMYGGNWEDLFAVAASWLALWKENNRQVWVFAATSGVTQKRPMRVTSKPANEDEARGR